MVHKTRKNVKEVHYNLNRDGIIEVELYINNEQVMSKTFPNLFPFLSFNYAKKLAKEQGATLHTMTSFNKEAEVFNRKLNLGII